MTHASPADKRSTREEILAAAEELFSQAGFDATRLEDIAERVGIRRASIVYYFKEKRELYEAVLEAVFSGLHQALETAIGEQRAVADRIEAAIAAWVAYVGHRPSLARLILREVADARPPQQTALLRHTEPLRELVMKEILGRPDLPSAGLRDIDPIHVASLVAGTTVFFVAAMPRLVPESGLDPSAREQLDTLAQELLHSVERLLGTRGR